MASYPLAFYVDRLHQVRPESVQELLNAIGDALATKFDTSVDTTGLIFGQLDGILPGKDVGPWANGDAWWFWNPQKGAYVQGFDGVPIGLIMMWGGQSVPQNWLNCDGREVSRTDYEDLFQVIGTTWGAGDESTTFSLPPGGVAFINNPGFLPDPLVTLGPNSPPYGVGCTGGSQLAPLLTGAELPPMQLLVPWVTANKKQPGVAGLSLPVVYSDTSAPLFFYQLQTNQGAELWRLAPNQSQFPTMPPFATANYIIKFQ